jgi:hypothetical protein
MKSFFKHYIYSVFLVTLTAIVAQAQTITTGSITSPICSNTIFSVPYTISGTFTSGNVFTAQLSNSSGSFSSPVNIGVRTATSAGTINALIPSGTPAGTGIVSG